MGGANSKFNKKLRNINRDVDSLRSSMRSSNRKISQENKNQLVDSLVQWSHEANSLKDKVDKKHLNYVQNNISHAMEDVFSKVSQEHDDLDMGAVETSSFVQVPVNKRQNPNKDVAELPVKKQKNSQVDFVRTSGSTLNDIEEKFKTLRPQIGVAIEQKDLTQLRIHQQTIKVLVTDLEMIEVREHTPLGDRKNKLDKSIMSQYNKITKTVKEIKRERDMNYLKKQNKRAQNELEEIQRELSEIDAILPNLLKNKDQTTMNGLRENILIIRQRLSSVESIDETTKQMQLQQQRRLLDISKILDDSTKSSSQSDLTKAQVNYEEIIRNIASGNSLDKDEIKVKLQSLQSFINSIKEEDENVQKGKQQLLYNVRQSFSFILDEEQKIQNTNIELNNKPREEEIKQLDNFYNNWMSLQKGINPSSLDDYSKIDKVLSDIQKSIEQKRNQIAEHNSLPSKLDKKLNRSTPNLSSPKPLHSHFGSTLSVDNSGQSFIRTRAKVYNLSTPQIQNINDQPVVLRNKQFYSNNINPNDNRPFSKIEEIKTQVNYIKEKFNESQQKQHLKNKLESYIEIINGYIHHQNQRIANSAKALLSDIQDMLKNISHIPEAMNVTSQRRASIELSFENIVSIQGSVEKLEKAVVAFEGKTNDPVYKKIMEELSDCKKYLQSTEIPAKYDMIQQLKNEILNKIEVIFNVLQSKCFSNNDSLEVTDTKKKLNSLKGKVNRFSGAYKGVLYNKIEMDLNKLLVNVTEAIDDKVVSEDITKDIEKHLQILEHRATKDQSFRRVLSDTKSRNEEEEKLLKLKSDLLDIKKCIDTTPANAINLFLRLKSRLDLVKLGLDQLKFTMEDEEKQKDILYNEVETLKNVVEAKISLAKQAVRQWPLEQDKEKLSLEELKKVEEKFKSFKPEIESFVGTTSDNKFYELDENSIRLILKMDKLQFERGSEAHNKKIELLKEIYNYGDLLDQRAKESEDLLDTERTLHDIEKNFARNLKLNDLEFIQEKLVDLKTKINKGQYNDHLVPRKQACIQGIEALFDKIAQNKDTTPTENVTKINTENEPDRLISNIELQFSNIKKEIDSFSGTHSDSKYYEINSSLTALFLKLDNLQLSENSELRPRKIVLLKEMHMYTEILYKKAKEYEDVQDINKQLKYINNMVDSYKGTGGELKSMENELKAVQKKLENIKIGDYERQSVDKKLDILIGEYTRLKKAKEEPSDYIGSTSFHRDVQNNTNKVQQNKTTSTRLTEIENEIYLVRKNVTTFMKSDVSEEYRTVEDTLLRLKMRLSKLETERNSELIRKQNELEKAIEECLNILDERSTEVASILEFENALDKINEKLEIAITENEKSAIDEKLISLQVKLGKFRVNKDLTQRKNMCADRINKYLKLLKTNPDMQNKGNSS